METIVIDGVSALMSWTIVLHKIWKDGESGYKCAGSKQGDQTKLEVGSWQL